MRKCFSSLFLFGKQTKKKKKQIHKFRCIKPNCVDHKAEHFDLFLLYYSLFFFQLLSSMLVQNGDDSDGIMGFMPNDILTEVDRAKKMVKKFNCILILILQNEVIIVYFYFHFLYFFISKFSKQTCVYCNKRGANIGCCHKSCRRAFHLPCAIKTNVLFEFNDTYRSFCDKHHNINRPRHSQHKSTDLCIICMDEMNKYCPTKSISSPCCKKSSWYHKRCLMEMAYSSGYFFKCPLCNNTAKFRNRLSYQGIFIPDRFVSLIV